MTWPASMTAPAGDDRSWLDVLADGVVWVDSAQRILAVNPVALGLTGHRAVALIGQPCGPALRARQVNGRPVWEDGWPPSSRLRSVRSIPEQRIVVRRED